MKRSSAAISSKKCANSLLMISHTQKSRLYHQAGLGEMVVAERLKRLIKKMGDSLTLFDLYSLFPSFPIYQELADLNYSLAERGHSIFEELPHPFFEEITKKVAALQPEMVFLLTWCWGMAALASAKLQQICPLIGKLYVFHENERVISRLYDHCDFLVTESLLAHQKGIQYGIPAGKMVYLPHFFPAYLEKLTPCRLYVKRLAERLGKTIPPSSLILGMVSRFESRKNIVETVRIVKKIVDQGYPVVLIWKGGISEVTKECELKWLKKWKNEPWFLWDDKPYPHREALRHYQSFDIALHLSGYEGASNVIVEYLALGKPTLILEGTTNPFLFKGGAMMVKNNGNMQPGLMPYSQPDLLDFEQKLIALIKDKNLREEWSRRARKVALERFHPDIAEKRLFSIIKEVREFKKGNPSIYKTFEDLYEQDLVLYQRNC